MSKLIECLLKRKGGTKASIGGTTYHFIDDDKERQVATVDDQNHVDRFLSIPEGYRLASGKTKASEPMGASAPVAPAAKPEPKVEAKVEPKPEVLQEPAKADDKTSLEDMTEDQLRTAFEAEVGRKPHPMSKDATMIAQIKSVRDEAGK